MADSLSSGPSGRRPTGHAGRIPIKVIRTNLADHPAVRAWRRLGGGGAELQSIHVLKEVLRDERSAAVPWRSKGPSSDSILELPRGRSAVYRLVGVGPEGVSVVA